LERRKTLVKVPGSKLDGSGLRISLVVFLAETLFTARWVFLRSVFLLIVFLLIIFLLLAVLPRTGAFVFPFALVEIGFFFATTFFLLLVGFFFGMQKSLTLAHPAKQQTEFHRPLPSGSPITLGLMMYHRRPDLPAHA
jgi:hypothetical protein